MKPRITVHVVMAGHLDPVWLWPWQAGLDEVLATCRTACDLLDEYRDLIFTAGEAWRYQQIEQVDPDLFARIKILVAAGRWEIVGGWWVQPDCNFPSGFGLERQIAVGKRYLLDRFGCFPEVAYNVDTFGHAASLPGILRAAGQCYYVMMRPQEHEMSLPACLFRWQGLPGGPEVLVFRIPDMYGSGPQELGLEHIRHALAALPEGIEHTLCFGGVGDHGGGPTAALIEWVRAHRAALPECRLVFSSTIRFFQAIAAQAAQLPLVRGELQYHAIGCYSVQRGLKTRVRRAEHLLRQAEIAAAQDGILADDATRLESAWQKVCFSHFHDTLGGTCISSAYPQQYDQLGAAAAVADELLQYGLRRKLRSLPDDARQRLVLWNASEAAFEGYVENEPWTQGRALPDGWELLDEQGCSIPCQLVNSEAALGNLVRILFRLKALPGAMRVLRINLQGQARPAPARVVGTAESIAGDNGVAVKLAADGGMSFPDGQRLALPDLELLDDASDTWTHRLDRYPEGPGCRPRWDAPRINDQGPCLAALIRNGAVGASLLQTEWRIYADELFVEWRLTVAWRERHKLLKLTLALPAEFSERCDGIPGASLVRPNNGRECPLRDWTWFDLGGRGGLGIVAPEVYALDAAPQRIRFTLLRSPLAAHHEPHSGVVPRPVFTDQGVHEFRFRFFAGADISPDLLEGHGLMMQRPLVTAELTRGMPKRFMD